MTIQEALKTWKEMKATTNVETLNVESYHALFHEVIAVLRPAVVAGLIPVEVLS